MSRKRDVLLGITVGIIGPLLINIYDYWGNTYESTDDVAPGFVHTSKLTFHTDDVDHDGMDEFNIQYGEKIYYLRLNSAGEPVIYKFEMKIGEPTTLSQGSELESRIEEKKGEPE